MQLEWVFNGNRVWVVQLHVDGGIDDPAVLVPGNPKNLGRRSKRLLWKVISLRRVFGRYGPKI